MPLPQHVTAQRQASSTPARRSLAFDLYRGTVWGDFDRDLGASGAVAQSIVGFVPVVGTVAAFRDLIACIGQRDGLGVILNTLAIFPVFGGFAKVADALHTMHRFHRASQRRNQHAAEGDVYQPPAPRRSGWASFGLSLLALSFALLYGLGVRLLLEYLWVNGPTIQGFALRGADAWLAPLILFPLGLIIGLVVTVGKRLWLGLALLPFVMGLGFFLTDLV